MMRGIGSVGRNPWDGGYQMITTQEKLEETLPNSHEWGRRQNVLWKKRPIEL